jgi:hypothetical protein
VLPARPYRPRDKAKVEAGVLIVERWLIGHLRHRVFYSLAALNAAIAETPATIPVPSSSRSCGSFPASIISKNPDNRERHAIDAHGLADARFAIQ